MRLAVPAETALHERRVALVPDTVARLVKGGAAVEMETGAGTAAGFTDEAYSAAGATMIADRATLLGRGELVLAVGRLPAADVELLAPGSVLAGFVQGPPDDPYVATLAARGVTVLAMERVPRTTKAQSMDALSSQSTIAGYKAVLLGAAELPRILPMLTTAAGTLAPARAFVIGAGVAGLQAIATARRLGAIVSAFDVRPVVKEQVESLGASFVEAAAVTAGAETAGGYARELADEQQRLVREAVGRHLREVDLVVTTAQIPGKPAPRLITADMVAEMKPGSVIVDLAAETGGNCELSRAGERTVAGGVVILAPLNVPATVPLHASQMYSRNLATLVAHLAKDGALHVDLEDPITGPMCLAHGGQVRTGASA